MASAGPTPKLFIAVTVDAGNTFPNDLKGSSMARKPGRWSVSTFGRCKAGQTLSVLLRFIEKNGADSTPGRTHFSPAPRR